MSTYLYGMKIWEPALNDDLVVEVYRKIFLSAAFSLDEMDEIAEAVLGYRIEQNIDFLNALDELYKFRAEFNLGASMSLEYIVRERGENFTLEELIEFKEFHKIEDNKFNDIVSEVFYTVRDYYNTPAKIKAFLDTRVIGQEDAKKILSICFYIHLIRIGYIQPNNTKGFVFSADAFPKPNLLLSGSTGSGKSFLINTLCDFFKLPFIRIDCSSLVSSGYVGNNLNTYLRSLVDRYGKKKAEKAILFFDEFDKISEYNIGRHGSVGGVELQQEFLVLLEDKKINVIAERSSTISCVLNSENMMLVFAGSFAGVERIIEKRLNKKHGYGSIGYTKKEKPKGFNLLKKIDPDDLIKFGIIPELVGRIGFIAVLDTLKKEELVQIMKTSKNNILEQYINYFKFNNDTIVIKDEVYELIAEEAIKRKTGARALQGVIMQLFRDLLFETVNDKSETHVIDADYFHQKIN
jgi:ATP-dependent Clp protease ATP-binding subunit ClpX